MKTKTLYRPVGEKEMILIAESNFKKFPPRLDWQPIFYPVLNEKYTIEISSQWNTDDAFGNYVGFVTKFEITEEEFLKHKIENVGALHNDELWVLAEDLETFNNSIVGCIEITKVHIGEKFEKAANMVIENIIAKYK